jgi:hypothetical protein
LAVRVPSNVVAPSTSNCPSTKRASSPVAVPGLAVSPILTYEEPLIVRWKEQYRLRQR